MGTLLSMLLASIVIAGPPGPTPEEVYKQVLLHRRSIRNGSVSLKSTIYNTKSGDVKQGRETTVWFDDRRIRADVVVRQGSGPAVRQINCIGCEKAGHSMIWSESTTPGSSRALEFFETAKSNALITSLAFDPRLLGMCPIESPNLALLNLESYIPAARDHTVLIKGETVHNGRSCWRLEHQLANSPCRCVTLVARECGPSVVSMTIECKYENTKLIRNIDVEPKFDQMAKVWFPQRVLFTGSVNGVPEDKEEVVVTDTSFNDPNIDKNFRLASMNIPAGTVVTGYTKNDYATWDGKSIVLDKPVYNVRKPAPRGTRYWLLGVSLLCAIGAAVVIVYRWYTPRAKVTPTKGSGSA
jgi:hypothetical protein